MFLKAIHDLPDVEGGPDREEVVIVGFVQGDSGPIALYVGKDNLVGYDDFFNFSVNYKDCLKKWYGAPSDGTESKG